MSLASLLLIAVTVSQTGHETLNPLFREVRETAIEAGTREFVSLPAPFLADGLESKRQQAVIQKLAGDDHPLEELVRDSVVAPHVYKLRDPKTTKSEVPVSGFDLWFVAFGDLTCVAKQDLQTAFSVGGRNAKVYVLTDAELAERKIRLRSAAHAQESFAHLVYPLLGKVEMSVTIHSAVSQTADSVLVVRRLAKAFSTDSKFPNHWQSLIAGADGALAPSGPVHPYEGLAMYLKATRLAEPKGALFVEYHQVFVEPKEWFDGANLLRSKLPILVQAEVRAFRRDVKKCSAKLSEK